MKKKNSYVIYKNSRQAKELNIFAEIATFYYVHRYIFIGDKLIFESFIPYICINKFFLS